MQATRSQIDKQNASKPSFVTTTCARDVHYAKALLASISFFYPDHAIIVIADMDLSKRHIKQLSSHPNTDVIASHEIIRKHSLPLSGLLTKLNLFFIDKIDACVFFDADSVLIGPILDHIDENLDFVALDGRLIDLDETRDHYVFNRYAVSLEDLKPVDPSFQVRRPIFFSGGHFYVHRASFPVHEIVSKIDLLNRDFAHKGPFRSGDQGFLTYIVNKYRSSALKVGYADLVINGKRTSSEYPAVTVEGVQAMDDVGKYIIHYTGPSRRYWFSDHNFGYVLKHFERLYYDVHGPFLYYIDQLSRGYRHVKQRSMKKSLRYYRKLVTQ